MKVTVLGGTMGWITKDFFRRLRIVRIAFKIIFAPFKKPVPLEVPTPISKTSQEWNELVQMQIRFVGKQVQGYFDDGSKDAIGVALCYDVDFRTDCKENESKYIYMVQHPNGNRSRTLNAKIIEQS